MARKGGLTPMWSDREVERWFDYFVDRAEERIYKLLQRAGEEFVKLARKKGNYQDHTGNLRSSIGYVIVKDGDILTENYELSDKKGTDKYTGLREAKRLVSELLPLYKNGWVLIGVAAMPSMWKKSKIWMLSPLPRNMLRIGSRNRVERYLINSLRKDIEHG